jgi:GrpB-like predicted nucleotidyltransferase (UPF0157 family)/ribosomal protein S18 acetylase RimI-like enzyme
MYLRAHQEEWQKKFLQERKVLQNLFRAFPCELHHIGSTSIVGVHAKPIVDILGVTPDITAVDLFKVQIETLGYTPVIGGHGLCQRRLFCKEGIHLHIFEDSDPETTRYLRFVSYLNANRSLCEEYSALKQQLEAQFPGDEESYGLGKEKWIKKLDCLAAQEKIFPCIYPPLGPRKAKWTHEEMVQAMHANFHLHMTYFAKFHPRSHLILQPDVTVVMSDVPEDTLNTVHGAHFTESNVRRRVTQVIRLFKQNNLPFAWWVSEREDTPNGLAQILEECGLCKYEEETGMYLELDNFHPHTPKEHFKRVTDNNATLRDFAKLVTSFSGHDHVYEAIYRELPPMLYQEGAPLEMYVLYKNGKPVTSGMALMHAHVMGIYYVATDPAYRKMGLGTEMMHFLLSRAKTKGYKVATFASLPTGKKSLPPSRLH